MCFYIVLEIYKFFLGSQNYGFISFLISREESDFFLGKIFHYLFIPKKKKDNIQY